MGQQAFGWYSEEDENISEDIVKGDGQSEPLTILRRGDKMPYYKIRQLPFVMRVNISSDETIYGVSDIDILEYNPGKS